MADEAERERLRELLAAWAATDPDLEPRERLALADSLRSVGAADLAARQVEVALRTGDDATRVEARLILARLRREAGAAGEALILLDGLPAAAAARLDVRLERCLALRALDRPRDAVAEYARLLPALEEGRPPEWWDVAEATARTYVEAGDVPAAREFLEDLRVLDPTFGGDEERRDRLVWLMAELDTTR